MPRTAATAHQAPAKIRVASSASCFAATTVTAPSAVADPPISSTVSRRRSTNSISHAPRPGPGRSAPPAPSAPPGTPRCRRRPRPPPGRAPPAPRRSRCRCRPRRPGCLRRPASAGRGTHRGRCGRRPRTAPARSAASESSRSTAVPLSTPEGRADLQHLAPPARLETGLPRGARDLARLPLGGLLVGGPAPVKRLNRSLVLDPQPGGVQRGALRARRRNRARSGRLRRAPGRRSASWAPGASSSRPWLPA